MPPNHDSSGDPATRAAGVGCVRVVAGPTQAARRQGITRRRRDGDTHFGWAINTRHPTARQQTAACIQRQIQARRALCAAPVLPYSGCRGEEKGAFEKPIPRDAPTPRGCHHPASPYSCLVEIG
jgi:hypothetical protein